MPRLVTPSQVDPFFFDRDVLEHIADDSTVADGLIYFKKHHPRAHQ